MAYDSARGVTVLFGGASANGSTMLNDTWEWDGSQWTERVTAVRPPAQRQHAMAYDAARRAVVLLCGVDGQSARIGQTWEWDGTTWSPRHTLPSNQERYGVAMAYDSLRQRVIRFGGGGAGGYWNQTHAWTGSAWTLLIGIGPPPRIDAQMAYDAVRDRLVLYGGEATSGYHQDTWEFDGTVWSERFPTNRPVARARYAMTFVESAARVVLFGSETPPGDQRTWAWDGYNWSVRPTATVPPARSQAAMVYDARRSRAVLFGGTYSNDIATWEYAAPVLLPGTFTSYGSGCASSSGLLAMTPATNSAPFVGSPFTLDLSPVPTGLFNVAVAILGASRTNFGNLVLPFDLSSLGMGGCQLWASAEVTLPLTRSGSRAPLSLTIPPDANLAGQSFYCQGLVSDPLANVGGIAWSNGIQAMIGLR